ncbi:uncharacterized protein BP01DRAFT_92978 [Aspergillus saccharolyticus JOP 1030-1]|uniref:Uncharacterized protein n=1 Tax=Aspergillus saccharolyticus JOP 1030-1 TaxID=1450539 RepID=A0A318ZJ88_9EURO|nr:hypothetical protein BP01DRAFT_92978 [Aspergillus saccharolyticus JOP 1030-1]PYH43790.1 hypothetical protein BP01DRAFT_92978 [Aspergillus saccharolyticus JOP 1030-1]
MYEIVFESFSFVSVSDGRLRLAPFLGHVLLLYTSWKWVQSSGIFNCVLCWLFFFLYFSFIPSSFLVREGIVLRLVELVYIHMGVVARQELLICILGMAPDNCVRKR